MFRTLALAIIFIGFVAISTGALILLDHVFPNWLGILLVSYVTLCAVGLVALHGWLAVASWRDRAGKR